MVRSLGPIGVRATLNEIKWTAGSLVGISILYRHRGAPADVAELDGAAIVGLGRSFIEANRGGRELMLPYHRVMEIRRGNQLIWSRRKP